MPLLTRRRVLAVKEETTPGSAETLTATQAQFNAFETEINPNIEFIERLGQSSLSPLRGDTAGRAGQVSFKMELSSDANLAVLLTACAMQLSGGAYIPNSGSTTTVTIGVYEDGVFKRLRGCMGTYVITLETGKPGMVEFTFTGIWDAPSDVAMLAPTYPSVSAPRFADGTVLIGAWTPKMSRVTIDCGNEVVLREDASDASGYYAAHVTGRRIAGTLDPEATLVADSDMYAALIGNTEQAMSISIGTSGGVTIDISVPKFQVTGLSEGDRNGLQIDEIAFQANRSSSAGDDELSITFG